MQQECQQNSTLTSAYLQNSNLSFCNSIISQSWSCENQTIPADIIHVSSKKNADFQPTTEFTRYKTRVSAIFYANLRLFTKFKSLILRLYYLPILDLQHLNHPGGSISFFAQKIADFKPTNTIVNMYNESISKNLRWPAPIYEI